MAANDRFGWLARWRQWLTGSEWPSVACEVAVDAVTAVRGARGGHRIEAWATRPLANGAVRPGPLIENVAEGETLTRSLREVLEEAAGREKGVALILPDAVARSWLLSIENLPEKPPEALALLRWRLAKEVAFDLEQAVVAYQIFSGRPSGKAVLVVAVLRSILRQYELCLEAAGYQPGWVTLATLATLGWMKPDSATNELLVRRDSESLGLAIVRGNDLRFVRCIPATLADGSADALFEQIYPSLVYFQDTWGEPVRNALLVGVGDATAALARLLAQEAGCQAAPLELGSLLPDAAGGSPVQARNLVAPLGFMRAGSES